MLMQISKFPEARKFPLSKLHIEYSFVEKFGRCYARGCGITQKYISENRVTSLRYDCPVSVGFVSVVWFQLLMELRITTFRFRCPTSTLMFR